MTKRRMLTAYACLVGVPLLGLLGILRAGQHLRAPLSVGGPWNLEADFGSLAGRPCGEFLKGVKAPFFTISQSGADLVATLNLPSAPPLEGKLEGRSLKIGAANSPASGAFGPCAGPESIYLTATVGGQGREHTLDGVLGISGCAGCTPVPFRAVQDVPRRKGAR